MQDVRHEKEEIPEEELEKKNEELDETIRERPLDNSIQSALVFLRDRNGIGNDQFSHYQPKSREGGVMETSTEDGDIKLEYDSVSVLIHFLCREVDKCLRCAHRALS